MMSCTNREKSSFMVKSAEDTLKKRFICEVNTMRYRIEYTDGRRCNFVNNRTELIKQLEQSKDKNISDIRKLYKNGISDSVMDKYEKYLHQ